VTLCDAVARLNGEGLNAHATVTMNLNEMTMPGGKIDALRLAAAEQSGAVTLGSRPYRQLPALYQSHDVFVFPSVSETFGHPMAEALAVGIPVIAADTSINREICGDAALYFEPLSVTDLCRRLTELDSDPAIRSRLTKAALERPRDQHNWDRHVDRLIETFESVRRK
jgi:glycosyltransferase involved in cell wall biosynthesis